MAPETNPHRQPHMPPEPPPQLAGRLLFLQAVFYIITGLWPLLHTRSFLAVTGPKTDIWLLKTLSLLITVVGAVLLQAALRRQVTPEVRSLAAGSAAVLAAADVYYVSRGRISPIYLLDAAAEAPFLVAWAAGPPSPHPGRSR